MSSRAPVVITGAGVVSALGHDATALHAALVEGRSGLERPRRVAEAPPAPLPAGLLVGEVDPFVPEDDLGADANLRPLDRAARLLTVAAARALVDAGQQDPSARDPARCGLVVGTTYGSLSTIAEFDRRQLTAGPRYVKPLDFANTVINAAAGQAAIWLALEGVNATFGGGTPAALGALAYAADQLRAGHADLLLAGGVEELAAESLLAFARAGLLAELPADPSPETGTAGEAGASAGAVSSPASGPAAPRIPPPFSLHRRGFALAEGAALMALETAERAAARGATALATVCGYASAFGEDERAVARAVAQALDDAGVAAHEIDLWVASANGSPVLDAREAAGVTLALGEHRPAVLVPKAALGDALGASGALAVASLLGIFATGILPPVPNFTPDPALPTLDVSSVARQRQVELALVTGLGFDGAAGALVLARCAQADAT
jgi:3-oxoacyl-[acyl-carrier-protein] synthase II